MPRTFPSVFTILTQLQVKGPSLQRRIQGPGRRSHAHEVRDSNPASLQNLCSNPQCCPAPTHFSSVLRSPGLSATHGQKG